MKKNIALIVISTVLKHLVERFSLQLSDSLKIICCIFLTQVENVITTEAALNQLSIMTEENFWNIASRVVKYQKWSRFRRSSVIMS